MFLFMYASAVGKLACVEVHGIGGTAVRRRIGRWRAGGTREEQAQKQ